MVEASTGQLDANKRLDLKPENAVVSETTMQLIEIMGHLTPREQQVVLGAAMTLLRARNGEKTQ